MNEGFFSSSFLSSFNKAKPLPPQLSVHCEPAEAEKAKPEPDLTSKIPQYVMDIECYINYFLVKFKNIKTKEILTFEQTKYHELETGRIKNIVKSSELITFNGNAFDIPLLRYALTGVSNSQLKTATNELIKTDIRPWQFEKKHDLPKLKIKHIDLVELAPGMVSLKVYGGRLRCDVMKDLPYAEDAVLTDDEMDKLCEYCDYDLDDTMLMFFDLFPQIEIRRVMSEKYGLDLLSKSDAQIAEAVIGAELTKITGKEYKKISVTTGSFTYKAPPFIQFKTKALIEVLELVTTKPFELSKAGKPIMPPELTKLKVKIGRTKYKMGMGGLHSQESSIFNLSDDKYTLWDWDVSSFYPMIMLICNLFPKHLGSVFLDIFEDIVYERLDAKQAKNKILAEVLKIVVNGTFGKLGSQYSIMTSPDLMIQVTVTGQLVLLMLIEMLEERGLSVISGNTDGIVIKCPVEKEPMMKFIINRWMKTTGFEMESAKYAGLYSRDVNNYLAFKYKYDKANGGWLDELDTDVKRKGCFAPPSIKISPSDDICSIALIDYIRYGTPLEHTIKNCFDVHKFLTVTTVNGGAVKNGEYVGKAVRFYHAKGEKTAIHYKTNGDKVSMTDGTKPLMDVRGGFPSDIDYDWYINRCYEIFYPSAK